MNTIRIKQIFQSKFDYQTYCNEIVHSIFGCNDVAIRPELLDTTAEGDECNYIGRMTDNSGRELGFFYTRVASGSDVRRKRVGLRKMIAPYLKYDADAAIAVFADENRWRLSYICDMKEGVTNAKRFSYILGDEQGQYKTPLERLDNIYAKRGRFVLNDLREAFSVDALSDEFFDEYHIHYDRIVAELARQGKSGAVYHDYVKKLMGRIVFLHFLQKKGWLCGDSNFMLNTFSQSNRKNDYLESVLEPLFFGILNTEPSKREQVFGRNGWQQRWVGQWANIPYLNGGLFERDAVDELKIVLPESIFSNLFSFLASYNFTVDENDPDDAEIGVDPEMLGKIFESLLEDNKAKGAFYTPKEIVRYMCKESLIAYLQTGIEDEATKESIRQFVTHHDSSYIGSKASPLWGRLEGGLRSVKICDPAIGSGAFPMGLLNELWRCREALEPSESRVALKKEIIENNIYGVDIERGAIDIARLRFWLSIVVDSEKAEPLPNFDYKFMQGNSLIESYQGCDLSRISGRMVGRPSTSTQLVIGLDSHLSRKNLQRLLRDYFSVTDHYQKATMRQAINEEVKTLIRESFGGTTASLAKLNALDPSANQEFFLWHTWFKDIFDNGGFDIVIGNPPYVNIANLTDDGARIFYQRNYKTVRNKSDLYSIFTERAHSLLRTKGICSYIFSNSWLGTDSFSLFRKFLIEETKVLKLVDLPDKVFENATVKTCIILFSKEKTTSNNIVLELYDGVTFSQMNHLLTYKNIKQYENYPFSFEQGIDLSKVKVIALGEIADFLLGIKTSNDKKFISNKPFPEDCYRLIRGRNIQRYNCPINDEWIWYRPDLFMEKVGAGPRKLENFLVKKKILIQDIAQEICATIDSNMYLCNDTINLIYSIDNRFKLEYILGLLNSKAVRFWHKKVFPEGLHIKIYQLKEIPIPVVTLVKQEQIAEIVDQILITKRKNNNADISALEHRIDKLVYDLYGLTEEEIAVIESE